MAFTTRSTIRSYRDLEVWQRGIELAEVVYRATERFPGGERFGLTAQLRRAVVAIPANVAEGWGPGSNREFLRFLAIARGSLYEVITHIEVSRRVGLLASTDASDLHAQADELGAKLFRYMRALGR